MRPGSNLRHAAAAAVAGIGRTVLAEHDFPTYPFDGYLILTILKGYEAEPMQTVGVPGLNRQDLLEKLLSFEQPASPILPRALIEQHILLKE